MLANLFFEVGSSLAIIGWLILVIGVFEINAKTTRWTLLLGGRVIPIVLSVLYTVLAAESFGNPQEGSYDSLESIGVLFQDPTSLSAGWLHFLAFDLLVGRWIVDETLNKKVSKWSLVLSLPLTFMFGPIGLLIHLIIRWMASLFSTNRPTDLQPE